MVGKMLALVAVLAVAASLSCTGERNMGLKSKRVLFSQVSGVVTKDGAPVAGAEVEQTVLYKEEGRTPQVTVVSDGEGKFAFAEVSANEGPALLPGEVTVGQRLVIRYQGQSYEGWNHGKKGKEANTEANGKPLRLVCELSTEPGVSGNSFGICRVVE
jgi:hypothetical protein